MLRQLFSALSVLMVLIFTAPLHAATITNGSITGTHNFSLASSVILGGPDVSAPGLLDSGAFGSFPLLGRPGDTVIVSFNLFTGTFATVDGIASSASFPFHPDSEITSFASISVLIPNDASAPSLSLTGPGTLTGSLSFISTTLIETIPFALHGVGTVELSGFRCPDGSSLCYEATSASLTATAVPEPSTWLLLASGIVTVGLIGFRRPGMHLTSVGRRQLVNRQKEATVA